MLGIMKNGAMVGCALATTCLAAPASAATFLFTFDGTTIDASGTLTTEDTPTAQGGFLITGITGTVGTAAITGLLAPGTFGGNDNLLFVGRDPLLSFGGFSFTADGSNNIFASSILGGFGLLRPDDTFVAGTFSITPAVIPPPVGAIPEPGTWALMLLGFGFVGAALRRRKATVAARYA